MNFLIRLAKQHDAEITILHVTNYVLSKAFEKEMFEKFRADIKEKILYDKLKVKLIKNDNLTEGLNTFCENEKADLLVMSPEKQNIFEKIFIPLPSVTNKMSLHSSIPLMAIPDFYNPEYTGFWKHYSRADAVNEEF
jgi:nucleotide-binding universal stress UspA family protein